MTVSLGERLHHAVYLLGLAGQPEAPQKLPESLNQVQVCELVQLQEGVQNLDVEFISARNTKSHTQTHTHMCTHTGRINRRENGISSYSQEKQIMVLKLLMHHKLQHTVQILP